MTGAELLTDVVTGLIEDHCVTHERSAEYVRDVTGIVDERRDPQVTLGVRLVSVVSDDLRHAGQAAFVRGLLPR